MNQLITNVEAVKAPIIALVFACGLATAGVVGYSLGVLGAGAPVAVPCVCQVEVGPVEVLCEKTWNLTAEKVRVGP